MSSFCFDGEEQSELIAKLRNEAKNKQSEKLDALLCGKGVPLVFDLLKGKNLSFRPFIDARKRYSQRISDQNNAYESAIQKAHDAEREAVRKAEEEKRQAQIREETRRREEEARWREECRRAEAAKRAERELMEQRRRKIRKAVTAAVCTVAAIGLVIFLVVLFTNIIPTNRYKKAQQLYEAGDYGEAYKLFDKLGDYEDSQDCREEVLPKAYVEALAYYKDGNLEKALDMFLLFGEYRYSRNYVNEIQSIPEYQKADVGDVVEFGTELEGGKSIKWSVLDKQDGQLLLFAKDFVDERPYDERGLYHDTTWEESSIRTWLNDYFIINCFTGQEIADMQTSSLRNPPNHVTGVASGNDTQDRVFLLSCGEVLKYLPEEEERTCGGTYDKWLLRTTGARNGLVMAVNRSGKLYYEGTSVFYDEGIRPAVWVKIWECVIYDDNLPLLEGAS